MAKEYNGKRYNENWEEIGHMGEVLGARDEAAARANAPAGWRPPGESAPDAGPPQQTPWAPAAAPVPDEPWKTKTKSNLFDELNLTSKVDTTDPAYRQQIEANRFTADRTADRARAAQAQRMAVNGTATGGGLETGIGRILSDQGAQEQGFEAQLMGKFRDQNLERMARALQLGSGLMTAEQEMALRAALTREGYALQRELGKDQLGYQRDALGQSGAFNQAQLDQNAILALLRGGG